MNIRIELDAMAIKKLEEAAVESDSNGVAVRLVKQAHHRPEGCITTRSITFKL